MKAKRTTKAKTAAKKLTATPMTQDQFNHLYLRTRRSIEATKCSASVAQEVYSLLLIDLVYNVNGQDEKKAATEMREIGDALAKRILAIPGVRLSLQEPATPKRPGLAQRAKAFLASTLTGMPEMDASRSVFFNKKGETRQKLGENGLVESKPKIIVPAPSNRRH